MPKESLSCERFSAAINWLLVNNRAGGQNDISAKSGIPETTISRILNGKVKQPKLDTIKSLVKAYPVLNINYLLGKSEYISKEDELEAELKVASEISNRKYDGISSMDMSMAIQREVEKATEQYKMLVTSLKDQLSVKDELIANLKEKIRDLEKKILQSTPSDLSDYPFTIGAAER